jgi:hypothetical protein
MTQFVQNSTDFSAKCSHHNGLCKVARENILFLDDGKEPAAIDRLQSECGYIVIIPDVSHKEQAHLYHTSCLRMTDVAQQIFRDCLEAPVGLPVSDLEMTLGEVHRQGVSISYNECKTRVENFVFHEDPQV